MHRAEAEQFIEAFQAIAQDRPAIFGGDCNVPAGDGALGGWLNGFKDAFDSAGIGWGNTVLNRMPVLRFDQIWHNDRLRPLAVWAVKAKHSDHRIVVADFELPSQ